MTILFIVGVIALAVGGLVLLLDGVFDLPDHQWFTMPGLAGGVATFCFTAGSLIGFGVPDVPAYLLGGVTAAGMYALLAWGIYKLRHATSAPDTSAKMVLGKTVKVITPIRPGGTGQVEVTVSGEKRRMSAISVDQIEIGQHAEVTELVSLTCVRVSQLR